MKGQPDLIINKNHKKYNGLCIEFKTPKNNGVISIEQKNLMDRYEENGFKCIIIANDYDLIIKEINEYLRDVRIQCKYCKRKFVSDKTLINHKKYIHNIKS